MLQLCLEGVEFRAPETPPFLRLALQLVEMRLRELEGEAPRAEGPPAPRRNDARGGSRGGRWFVDRLPRILLPEGGDFVPRNRGELEEFIRRRGLSPHRRGDASMLLWQVRERLGLRVEALPLEGATGTPSGAVPGRG